MFGLGQLGMNSKFKSAKCNLRQYKLSAQEIQRNIYLIHYNLLLLVSVFPVVSCVLALALWM